MIRKKGSSDDSVFYFIEDMKLIKQKSKIQILFSLYIYIYIYIYFFFFYWHILTNKSHLYYQNYNSNILINNKFNFWKIYKMQEIS